MVYEEQTQLAERELSSFIAAVTELYGAEQATLSEKDWLDESDLMDAPAHIGGAKLAVYHDRGICSTGKSRTTRDEISKFRLS
ncbi:MAG TPA: hypothetical protein VHA06_00185 [Candidatus Angelobacter sp.]|nr:hypothetical protein [Candidatus Angelobacter sp.]